MKILLASQSPRRRELLHNLGYDFEVVTIDCDETYPENIPTEKVAGFLSELKAESFKKLTNDQVLITADTIVCVDNEILGKPKNTKEAQQMLLKLSNKTHQVYTGITLKSATNKITKIDVAHVTFDEISAEEANYYIQNYKPFDKAGSYGIQEWLGMAKIRKIQGSFYTIMGLPTHLIYQMLQEIA